MGTYEKNHNLVILVPQLVIHATAGMMSWGHGNPVKHAGDSRLPTPLFSRKRKSSTTCSAIADSLLAFWIPDTMKNMVAGAPYFSIVRE